MSSLPDVAVLLSGGLDSAACLAYYRDRGNPLLGVFVDYGQRVAIRERDSAKKIATWYGIRLREVTASSEFEVPTGEVPGRNAFLVFAAMAIADVTSGFLALGIHDGTTYYDCTPHFLTSLNRIVSGYADGRLEIVAPFSDWTKRAIWEFAKLHEVPLHLTWSCETDARERCGTCRSCIDSETLRAST
jgi:7-cyano-7-deazaguanine synthase